MPFISCHIRDSGRISVADFNDQTDVNIVSELANGKTIISGRRYSSNLAGDPGTTYTLDFDASLEVPTTNENKP